MTSRLALLALLALFTFSCTFALPALAADADKDRVVTVMSENDLYAAHNRDRHYTNGIRLGWMSGQDTDWASWLGQRMPLPQAAEHYRIGFALGHNLYTPQDKSATGPLLDDRPYGAWL